MKKDRLNTSLKLIVKTSFIVFVGLIISKILAYGYRVIIARYFGPETYGLFSLALMIIGWFISLSTLGFGEGVLRYISLYRGKKETEKIKYIFQFSFFLSILLSIVCGIMLYVFAGNISIELFHNPSLIIFLKIFSILIPISTALNIFIAIIKAYEMIDIYAYVFYIFQNIIRLTLLGLFIWVGFGVSSIIWSWLLSIAAMLLAFYAVFKRKMPEIFKNNILIEGDKRSVRSELIDYSWPLMFLAMISSILYWIDSFSIGYYKSALEVGFYNAAIPIAMLLTIAPELFIQLFFPIVTKEYARKNLSFIRDLSQQISKWIFAINVPVFILMMIFPGAIINILFGQEYLAATTSLRFLLTGSLAVSLFSVSNNLLSMIGKSKLILLDISVASLLNLILNITLVPIYGIDGAAFSTMLSYFILGSIFFFQVKYYTKINPFKKELFRIILLAIIPALLLYFVHNIIQINLLTLSLIVALYFIVYFILVYIGGGLNEKDLMILKAIKRKIVGEKISSGVLIQED